MNSIDHFINAIKLSWSEPKLATHRGETSFSPLRCTLSAKLSDTEKAQQYLLYQSLPDSLQQFYGYSNGALLYEDTEYGQWGLRLYPLNTVETATASFEQIRQEERREGDLIIGEFLGDSDLLLLRADPTAADYGVIMIALPIDPRSNWYIAAPDFSEFLEKLYTYEGDKYWEIKK